MKRFSVLINESKSIKDLPTSNVAILFTDVKDSSNLWAKNEDAMYESLTDLEDMMNEKIADKNGMVVKTIGDSFMCSYESKDALLDAIKTAIDIQKHLRDNPIKAGNDKLNIRIGICYGEIYIRESKIQSTTLKDYFGNAVNTASRMESKVSEVGGFAFSFLEKVENEEEILKYLEDNDIKIEVIEYDNKCDKDKERKRSARLLTDLQINACKDVEELKGVNSVRVYKCKLKNA
jgi:hypothetical protein